MIHPILFFQRPLLAVAGSLQSTSIRSGTLVMWDSISAQGRDQSCVNGQLSPVENGQPLCDHFKATTVNTTQRGQVQVPNENVGGDTSSNLTADTCRSRLQREAASSSTPEVEHAARWWPRTATPAGTRRKRERKTKTMEEKNAKEHRIEALVHGSWENDEGQTREGPTL